ncbi:uncharacterized protein LOC114946321 [Nylanderia fulva]|uniref:uncharacterized protein LOC114946321 n=1 Tax=Nylanderia fulva TaxID=613905 RepID=UPI0010FAF174|nr:uncharacterized protein LOC114946321 [Nylanderia fulva]
MLKTLKILCVLLKIFMLMRTAFTSSSKDQEDCLTQDNPSFRFIDVHEYVSSNHESVQYYFENDTVRERNEVGESTPSSESIPSEPTCPRAFVEFNDRLNQKDIIVTFRWNKPKFTNEVIQKYTVQYWFFENQIIHRKVAIISNFTILQLKVYNLKPDKVYYFKVQAHNKFGAGSYTKFINVSTTHENPVPLLLVKKNGRFYVLDIDLQIGFERDIKRHGSICLIPTKDYRVEEVLITANSIKVNLPEPNPNDEYNDLNKFEKFHVQTYERQYEFQNLTQLTEYTLKLALSNFYIYKISMDLQFGPDVKLITTGKLYAPDDVVVQVVMPNLAVIDWMPPKKLGCVAVNYEVKMVKYPNSTQENQNSFRFIKVNKLERTTNDKFFAVISSLIPKQKYEIYVSVYPIIRTDVVTDSVIKTVYMSEPNNLSLNGIDTNRL